MLFVSSAATAAGGLGLLGAPLAETGPARALACLGAGAELVTFETMRRRMGLASETYSRGAGGRYRHLSTVLAVGGAAVAVAGRRSRTWSAASGLALLGASAATRWSVFHAGVASAADPRYTVVPQRERLERAGPADS